MSTAFDDIMESLNELKEAAEGKPTGIVVHSRTVKELDTFTLQKIWETLQQDPDSFTRYYPAARVRFTSNVIANLVRAILVNDALCPASR